MIHVRQGAIERAETGDSKMQKAASLLITTAMLLAGTGMARAQQAASPRPAAADEGEIVVTAQKREQRLSDVPIAVTAIGGDALEQMRVQGVADAIGRTPGVSAITSTSLGGTSLAVRGVSAGSPIFAGSSPVGYYVDAVPFGLVKSALVPDPAVYDLERVEVLRGPQGTLYGASSINGVVRVLTREPDLANFDFRGLASTSWTKGGDQSYRGDLAVNVPLIEDALGARLVLGHNHVGGWIDRPGAERANEADLRNIRLKVRAEPTDRLSIGGSVWLSRTRFGAPNAGGSDDRSPYRDVEQNELKFDSYGLNVDYDFGGASLKSTTSYLRYSNKSGYDYGDPYLLVTDYQSRIFTEELLLSSNGKGKLGWSVGAFYREGRDTPFQDVLPTGTAIPAPFDYDDTSRSYALFGEITFPLVADKLELTAGLRYFHDRVGQAENTSASGDPTAPLLRTQADFSATTPRVVLTWRPAPKQMVYASYSEGFRSGFEQDVFIQAQYPGLPAVEPDKLRNYELGMKGDVFGGRLNYEAAVYFIDWKDVQQSLLVPFGNMGAVVLAVVNGESASGFGVDAALTGRPFPGLDLGVNFSWNKLELDRNVISGGTLLFAKGDRLNNSPRLTLGAFADYSFPLDRSGWTGRFSTGVNYSSKNQLHAQDQSDPAAAVIVLNGDSSLIARASFTVSTPGRLDITAFVDNISNERGRVQNDLDPFRAARVQPRRIGVQLEYRFR